MSCRNICGPYRISPTTRKGVSNFTELKRCTTCVMLLKWDGVYCPCCSKKLATKPKGANGWKNMERKRI